MSPCSFNLYAEWKVKVKVTQSCPILCNPMDYTAHGILQARILECIAIPFSRGSSQPRNQTQVSCIACGFFNSWATREAKEYWSGLPIPSPVDLPDPEIELGSPALQKDSLPSELPGNPFWQIVATQKIIAITILFYCIHPVLKRLISSGAYFWWGDILVSKWNLNSVSYMGYVL